MPIILVILIIALIGVVVWACITYIPMPQPFKLLIVIAAVLLTVIWILTIMGVSTLGPAVPRIR